MTDFKLEQEKKTFQPAKGQVWHNAMSQRRVVIAKVNKTQIHVCNVENPDNRVIKIPRDQFELDFIYEYSFDV
jgi:hypothetical protein